MLTRNTLTGFIILAFLYFIFYCWLDIPLMYQIHVLADNAYLVSLSHRLSNIFAPKHWVELSVLVLMITMILKKSLERKIFYNGLFFSVSTLLAGILVTFLKIVLGRYRPEMLLSQNLYGFHFFALGDNFHSTPSGHATLAFCGFYALARIFKQAWLSFLLLALAVLICFAKLILADHYCSDILFGAYLGLLCVIWSEILLKRFS